jgi:hypothetical protein
MDILRSIIELIKKNHRGFRLLEITPYSYYVSWEIYSEPDLSIDVLEDGRLVLSDKSLTGNKTIKYVIIIDHLFEYPIYFDEHLWQGRLSWRMLLDMFNNIAKSLLSLGISRDVISELQARFDLVFAIEIISSYETK